MTGHALTAVSVGLWRAVRAPARLIASTTSPEARIHWVLRVTCAAIFIGHGAFGISTKDGWLPYFDVAHIGPDDGAYVFMRLIGTVDIIAGLIILVRPVRIVLAYMIIWATWTAMLRPLAGEGGWEFLERSGNYGVPLAYLVLAGWGASPRDWVAEIRPEPITDAAAGRLKLLLRVTIALFLIGHGGFGAHQEKQLLVEHWASIGFPESKGLVIGIGWFEIALGLAVLVRPLPALLIFVVAWKLFTELLYPISGVPVPAPGPAEILFFETVERSGDYGAPLALLLLQQYKPRLESAFTRARQAQATAVPAD